MKSSTAQFSPQAYARIGGVLYLIIIAAGLFAEAYVPGKLVVPADAAATATNIMAHETLFRLGIAADLTTFLFAVALTMILYVLLKPVNRNLALLMVFFNLVQDAIGGKRSTDRCGKMAIR
jgi:ABC-type multidrug transport system permease subunit